MVIFRAAIGIVYIPIYRYTFEMLCIKVEQSGDVTFVCALYHPHSPITDRAELLDLVENTDLQMHQDYPNPHIILAGDL